LLQIASLGLGTVGNTFSSCLHHFSKSLRLVLIGQSADSIPKATGTFAAVNFALKGRKGAI